MKLGIPAIYKNVEELITGAANNELIGLRYVEFAGWVYPEANQLPPKGLLAFKGLTDEGVVFVLADGTEYVLPTSEDTIYQFHGGHRMSIYLNKGNTELQFILNPLW